MSLGHPKQLVQPSNMCPHTRWVRRFESMLLNRYIQQSCPSSVDEATPRCGTLAHLSLLILLAGVPLWSTFDLSTTLHFYITPSGIVPGVEVGSRVSRRRCNISGEVPNTVSFFPFVIRNSFFMFKEKTVPRNILHGIHCINVNLSR